MNDTNSRLLFSVIAGFPVGISIVVLFVSFSTTAKAQDLQSPNNDRQLIDSTVNLEAAKALVQTYRNSTVVLSKTVTYNSSFHLHAHTYIHTHMTCITPSSGSTS